MFGMRELIAYLAQFEISPRRAMEVFRTFGPGAMQAIQQNPYLLCGEPLQLDFRHADSIAQYYQMAGDCAQRLEAALLRTLRHNAGNGHTCLPRAQLLETASNFIHQPPEKLAAALDSCIQTGKLAVRMFDGTPYIYLPDLLAAEQDIADRLAMLTRRGKQTARDLDKNIQILELAQGFAYAPLQKEAIRKAMTENCLVLTGGPGTGKTAVALHRAAYLLYTHRRTLERSGVLVVGPSSAFLHYIDQVLPSLGETGVVSRTISDLIPGITATAVDSPYAAKLKGDRRMTSVVANAIAARVRVPAVLPTVTISGIQVPMLATDIEQAQADAKRTRQPHNKARETFIRSMLTSMQNRYAEQLDYTPDQAELNRAMSLLRMNEQVRKTLNLCWLPMTAPWLIDQLFAHPERLKSLAGWLTDNDIAALARPKGSPLTRSDIPLLDEAMDMLGPDPKTVARQSAADARRAAEEQYAKDTLAATGLGGGIVSSQMLLDQMNGDDAELTAQRAAADREWTYGHIVVDEAQELTAMDWRMLIRRCPSRSFTIVGDVAQTSALGGTRRWSKSMNRLFGESHWDLNELTINYRNPQEVSELASRFAEKEGLYISTVNAVRTIPDSVSRNVVPDMSSLLETTAERAAQLAEQFVSADGTGRIAVICPDDLIAPVRDAVRRKLAAVLDPAEYARLIEQPEWDEQISVCGTETVKGLEFDAVVVVEPGLIEDDAPSRLVAASDLYVAMTRPTQKLVIVRTRTDEKSLNI